MRFYFRVLFGVSGEKLYKNFVFLRKTNRKRETERDRRGKYIIMALIVFPIKFIFVYSSCVSVHKIHYMPFSVYCTYSHGLSVSSFSPSRSSLYLVISTEARERLCLRFSLTQDKTLIYWFSGVVVFTKQNSNKFNCQFRSHFLSFSLSLSLQLRCLMPAYQQYICKLS